MMSVTYYYDCLPIYNFISLRKNKYHLSEFKLLLLSKTVSGDAEIKS
jgi:hypothetical protein